MRLIVLKYFPNPSLLHQQAQANVSCQKRTSLLEWGKAVVVECRDRRTWPAVLGVEGPITIDSLKTNNYVLHVPIKLWWEQPQITCKVEHISIILVFHECMNMCVFTGTSGFFCGSANGFLMTLSSSHRANGFLMTSFSSSGFPWLPAVNPEVNRSRKDNENS